MSENNEVRPAYGQPGHVRVPKGFFMACYKDKGQLGDKIIRLGEGGAYSHNEIVFSNGISASASWRDGAVRQTRIDFSTGKWDFIPLDPEKETRAKTIFDRLRGFGYDYLGVITFPLMYIIPGWKGSEYKYFCSEICSLALELSGRSDRIGPNMLAYILTDIANAKNLKLVY